MKVWEEILQRIRNGEPLEEVRRDYRSDSQFAKAVRVYVAELSAKAEEILKANRQADQMLKEAKFELERVQAEKMSLEKDVSRLKKEEQAISTQIQSAKETVAALQTDVETLSKAGFTREVIDKVKKTWVKNGAEALSILQDLDEATALRDLVQNLNAKTTALERSIGLLERKHKMTVNKLKSEENRLDRIKARGIALQKVVCVVEAALQRSYTPQQLISILDLLNKMEIHKEPEVSITHLLECVAEARNLLKLKRETGLAEQRLAEILKAEAEARDRVEILQTAVVSGIEMARKEGEETIVSVGLHAKTEVSRMGSQSVDAIKAVGSAVNEAMCRDVKELAKLRQEIGRLESWIEPARILYGMIQSPEILNTIPPAMAIALLQNLAMWCDRFPDADIGAVYDSAANEFRPNKFVAPRFRISALVRLAVGEITRLISKRLKEEST